MEQVHAQKRTSKKEEAPQEAASKTVDAETQAKHDQLKAEEEALLDEIDELMGELNAEEFVKGYVQKGGQ